MYSVHGPFRPARSPLNDSANGRKNCGGCDRNRDHDGADIHRPRRLPPNDRPGSALYRTGRNIHTQLDRLETETRDAAKERLLLDLREYELLKNAPDPEWTEFFIRTHWKPRIPWP